MPLAALLALLIAFWVPLELGPGEAVVTSTAARVGCVVGGFVVMGILSWILGRVALRNVGVGGRLAGRRRWGPRAGRLLELAAIVLYAVMIFVADWPGLTRRELGLDGWLLVDEIVIFAPFPLLQLIGWWFLYPSEWAWRVWRRAGFPPPGRARQLVLRARQSYGLLIPVTMLLGAAQDLSYRVDPEQRLAPWSQLVGYGGMTLGIVLLSPALIRLTWPTRSLPEGPLRERLEHLSARLNFRFSDILLWDTGGAVVNAGVTGSLPWFRYVLLTDALVDNLEPRQIEAVFGHEVGHVAHRHLSYFASFFLGSVGIMAMVVLGVEHGLTRESAWWIWGESAAVETAIQALAGLILLGGYFFLVFGFLSRRFERQADLFGCQAVSCGRAECPPHLDINASTGGSSPAPLCPVGIRIFIDALTNVALLNGLEPRRRSWRHGSIERRIAFLEGLEHEPTREREFQRGVRGLRAGILLALGAALLAAYFSGALAAV